MKNMKKIFWKHIAAAVFSLCMLVIGAVLVLPAAPLTAYIAAVIWTSGLEFNLISALMASEGYYPFL